MGDSVTGPIPDRRAPSRRALSQGFPSLGASRHVALATDRAAVQRWPNAKITLRNRARVIERSWRD
jgi:hypothetical protein